MPRFQRWSAAVKGEALRIEEEPTRGDQRPARIGHLTVPGNALQLVNGLPNMPGRLGGALGQRTAVRIDRDPAVDQGPARRAVPMLAEEVAGLPRLAPRGIV